MESGEGVFNSFKARFLIDINAKVNNVSSDWAPIKLVVPQESVLGPLLFMILMTSPKL